MKKVSAVSLCVNNKNRTDYNDKSFTYSIIYDSYTMLYHNNVYPMFRVHSLKTFRAVFL